MHTYNLSHVFGSECRRMRWPWTQAGPTEVCARPSIGLVGLGLVVLGHVVLGLVVLGLVVLGLKPIGQRPLGLAKRTPLLLCDRTADAPNVHAYI